MGTYVPRGGQTLKHIPNERLKSHVAPLTPTPQFGAAAMVTVRGVAYPSADFIAATIRS